MTDVGHTMWTDAGDTMIATITPMNSSANLCLPMCIIRQESTWTILLQVRWLQVLWLEPYLVA